METSGTFTKKVLATALGTATRWTLLEELSKGGLFTVAELAQTAGVTASAASKHMLLLARAGIVVSGKGRLYTLAPGVLAEDGRRELRLGMCTLRFGDGGSEGGSVVNNSMVR